MPAYDRVRGADDCPRRKKEKGKKDRRRVIKKKR